MSNLPFPGGRRGRGPGGGPVCKGGGQEGIDQKSVPGMRSEGSRALAWPGHSCVRHCVNEEALPLTALITTALHCFTVVPGYSQKQEPKEEQKSPQIWGDKFGRDP